MMRISVDTNAMSCMGIITLPRQLHDESQAAAGQAQPAAAVDSSSSRSHGIVVPPDDNSDDGTLREIRLKIKYSGIWLRLAKYLFESCIEFFCTWHVSSLTVYRLSICAIVLHLALSAVAGLVHDKADRPLPPDSVSVLLFHYLVPCLTAVFTLSSVMVVWMKCFPTQAVVLTGMVTLFLVECLFPLTVTICFILFSTNIISFLDSVIISVSMLTVSAMSSWCIRTVLYPSLGHG